MKRPSIKQYIVHLLGNDVVRPKLLLDHAIHVVLHLFSGEMRLDQVIQVQNHERDVLGEGAQLDPVLLDGIAV